MQLTLQAEEVRRFHEIVRWTIRRPKYLSVHFITFRNKPALAIHHYDWSLIMPIRGRKPQRPFKIPYKQLQEVPDYAEGDGRAPESVKFAGLSCAQSLKCRAKSGDFTEIQRKTAEFRDLFDPFCSRRNQKVLI